MLTVQQANARRLGAERASDGRQMSSQTATASQWRPAVHLRSANRALISAPSLRSRRAVAGKQPRVSGEPGPNLVDERENFNAGLDKLEPLSKLDKLDKLDGKLQARSADPSRQLASGDSDEAGLGPAGGGDAQEGAQDARRPGGKRATDERQDARRRPQDDGPAERLGAQHDKPAFRAQWVWRNIFLFVLLHSMIPVALYQIVSEWPIGTLAWMLFTGYLSGLGVTGGTHRLWSHRSYKARLPLELLLMALQTMAGQNSIYVWSRDHRLHHKFSETDADPHNIKRGFFFAHMGWLCCRKHPEVRAKGQLIDMSDLAANPVVMFQRRHFWWLALIFNLLLPVCVPVLLWRERLATAFVIAFGLRYLLSLHGTWLVNSAAHYYGPRPYDARMEARESPAVILMGFGEGFHNYHHTFPYDYSTSEFGRYFNLTTAFIDVCARLGLASERRKVEPTSVLRRQLRTGDGSGLEGKPAQLAQAAAGPGRAPAAGQLDMIHELPYISGLTSLKYTM